MTNNKIISIGLALFSAYLSAEALYGAGLLDGRRQSNSVILVTEESSDLPADDDAVDEPESPPNSNGENEE
jgi:hypothetical protein